MINFIYFFGVVTLIEDFLIGQNGEGCFQLMRVENSSGEIVNFVISPTTYFVNQVSIGDYVTGYYDGNAPVPLIYPPQYQALVMVKYNPQENVKVGYFNSQLISSDGQLLLNLSPDTKIVLQNGQAFLRSPGSRNLIVLYGPSTRSIPAQTTPYKIIVLC